MKRYSHEIREYISFNEKVESVKRIKKEQWKVKTSKRTLLVDSVVVCNGHYEIGRMPDVHGLN